MRYEIINSGPDALLRLHCACGHAIDIPVALLEAGHLMQCPGCRGYFRVPGERVADADYQGADQ